MQLESERRGGEEEKVDRRWRRGNKVSLLLAREGAPRSPPAGLDWAPGINEQVSFLDGCCASHQCSWEARAQLEAYSGPSARQRHGPPGRSRGEG